MEITSILGVFHKCTDSLKVVEAESAKSLGIVLFVEKNFLFS